MRQTLDLTSWVLWVPCTANYVRDFFTPIQVYYSDIHFWFSSTTYSLNYCNTIWSSHLFSLCTHLTKLFRANERYEKSSGTWSMKMSNQHLVSLHVCVHHCVCCVSWLGGWKYAGWMCKRGRNYLTRKKDIFVQICRHKLGPVHNMILMCDDLSSVLLVLQL